MSRFFLSTLLAVFLLGTGLRLAEAWKIDSASSFKENSRVDYFEFGKNLRELGVLGWSDGPSAFRGAVYPVFLSIVEAYRPDRRPRAPIVQALLAALAIPLAALIAWRLFSAWAGLAAALLTALHPALGRSVPGCKIEPLFGVILLAVATALILWGRETKVRNSLLLAFAVAVSLMSRSVLFLFPPLAVLVVWASLKRPPRKEAAAFLACSYLFLAPWVVRNAVQFGRFIPFEEHAATRNFFAASLGVLSNADIPQQDIIANEIDPDRAFGEDPAERLMALAVRNIKASPGAYLASCFRRLLYLLKLHPILFPMSLLVFIRERKRLEMRLLGALCAYYVLVHTPMTLEDRYMEPLLPTLIVIAAGIMPDPSRSAWGRSLRSADKAWRAAPALIIVILLPLYALSAASLGKEIALSRFPCVLPESALSLLRCGEARAAAGDPEAAQRKWMTALPLIPRDSLETPLLRARIEMHLAMARLGRGDARSAAEYLGGVVGGYPDEVLAKALWLQDHERIEDALVVFDLLVGRHPDNERYLGNRGVANVVAGRVDEGLMDFKRALALSPGEYFASINLGALLESRGLGKEALDLYEQALERSRRSPPITGPRYTYLRMISSRAEVLRGAIR